MIQILAGKMFDCHIAIYGTDLVSKFFIVWFAYIYMMHISLQLNMGTTKIY